MQRHQQTLKGFLQNCLLFKTDFTSARSLFWSSPCLKKKHHNIIQSRVVQCYFKERHVENDFHLLNEINEKCFDWLYSNKTLQIIADSVLPYVSWVRLECLLANNWSNYWHLNSTDGKTIIFPTFLHASWSQINLFSGQSFYRTVFSIFPT